MILSSSQTSSVESKTDSKFALAAFNHSDLYNAMMHPFTRMVIYGAIWYQGKGLAQRRK